MRHHLQIRPVNEMAAHVQCRPRQYIPALCSSFRLYFTNPFYTTAVLLVVLAPGHFLTWIHIIVVPVCQPLELEDPADMPSKKEKDADKVSVLNIAVEGSNAGETNPLMLTFLLAHAEGLVHKKHRDEQEGQPNLREGCSGSARQRTGSGRGGQVGLPTQIRQSRHRSGWAGPVPDQHG